MMLDLTRYRWKGITSTIKSVIEWVNLEKNKETPLFLTLASFKDVFYMHVLYSGEWYGYLINNELGRKWNEVLGAYFKVQS
jgi:hypothetical protein